MDCISVCFWIIKKGLKFFRSKSLIGQSILTYEFSLFEICQFEYYLFSAVVSMIKVLSQIMHDHRFSNIFCYSSINIRGILLTSTAIVGISGTLAAYAIGPFVSYAATGYIVLIINIVHVIGILFIPESPVYYAIKGMNSYQSSIFFTYT